MKYVGKMQHVFYDAHSDDVIITTTVTELKEKITSIRSRTETIKTINGYRLDS